MVIVNVERREFLKRAGFLGLGGSAAAFECASALASETGPASGDGMGVLVDLTKCNGCRQCEAVCREAAGYEVPSKEELLDESVFLKHRRPGPRSYTTVNRFTPRDDGDPATAVFVKANCLHCLDPACVSACLVGAMRKQVNGAVTYDAGKCMGCRYCMVACPFQMPAYDYESVFTPEVRKCSFCFDKTSSAQEAAPECVRACPKQCLIHDKRQALLAQAHEQIKDHPERYIDHVYGEHEAGGTAWLYLSGTRFEELGFLDVGSQAAPRLSEAIQHGVFNHFIPPVAWAGLLGLAMWLSKPDQKRHAAAEPAEGRLPVPRREAAPSATSGQRREGCA